MRRLLQGRTLILLLLAAAAALFLLPLALEPTAYPFPPGADYSDALIAHLSSARFLHRAILQWGQIPLWNPTLLSGMPFAADPLSGLWYPPFWALALIPEAIVFNLILWIHLLFGGYGFFRLLRAERLGVAAALTGSLAFAGMPKLLGHIGLGHLSLVAAVCWSPWILLTVAWAIAGLEHDRWLRRFVVPGILLGVVFLADPRWFVPVFLVALGYGVWQWAISPKSRRGAATRLTAAGGVVIVGAAAVAAGLALPMGEFVFHTTRVGITASPSDAYALPPQRLIGLIVATRGAWAEWMVSMGSVTLVAAAAGVGGSWRRASFWLGVLLVVLVLALGDATPVGRFVTVIPGVALIRVPARWLFFSGISLAALAAYGVDAFAQAHDPLRIRRATRAAVLVGGVILLTSVAFAAMGAASASAVVSGFLAVATLVVFFLAGRERRPAWVLPLVPALIVAELAWIDVSLIQPRPADAAMAAGVEIAAALTDLEPGFRVFSPSYSVPQEAAAGAGLELADGVHPLQLAPYVEYMAAATGFDPGEYSVTLPPFPSGDPTTDWGPALDARALGLLAVSRVVSAFPVEAEGLELSDRFEGAFVYENLAVRPRAWIESNAEDAASSWRAADSIDWTPNRVGVTVQGPGTLVLSDPMYPGWRAKVDGKEAPISLTRGLLRSVELPPGAHEVVFTFIPLSLYAGLGVSLLAAVFAVALWRRA